MSLWLLFAFLWWLMMFSCIYWLLTRCKHTIDFCILILYPESSLNSFISSNNFLLYPLGLSIYDIRLCHLPNERILLLPLQSLISFSYLITLAWTSRAMLSRSEKSPKSFLIPFLTGKACSLLLLSIMLAVGLL